jgi:pSer/pThr/pTyr-binding forkhead associated (FHA) protein
MASLCLLDEIGAVASQWELGALPLAIGRDESAEVRIDDPALSRRHFLIERQGEKYVLRDLHSQNGTWVDGQPASTTQLHHCDCIAAGKSLFVFRESVQPP